jgi:hypothetical protein
MAAAAASRFAEGRFQVLLFEALAEGLPATTKRKMDLILRKPVCTVCHSLRFKVRFSCLRGSTGSAFHDAKKERHRGAVPFRHFSSLAHSWGGAELGGIVESVDGDLVFGVVWLFGAVCPLGEVSDPGMPFGVWLLFSLGFCRSGICPGVGEPLGEGDSPLGEACGFVG